MDKHTLSGPVQVQSYETLAAEYDQVRFVGSINQLKEQYRERAILAMLPVGVEKALDVACGTGRGLVLLRPHAKITVGVDGTLGMLREAVPKITTGQQLPRVCQGNAASLPFENASFDCVTCLNFFHLFEGSPSKLQMFAEIRRVLKPAGAAILEFDNALHGVALGPVRKTFGTDIGYEWPWRLMAELRETFAIEEVRGTNLPFIWRMPGVRALETYAAYWPLRWVASRLLVKVTAR